MENNKLTPEQKAAAVIVSLGAEKASKIYKHLSESEIEKLTIETVTEIHTFSPPTSTAKPIKQLNKKQCNKKHKKMPTRKTLRNPRPKTTIFL